LIAVAVVEEEVHPGVHGCTLDAQNAADGYAVMHDATLNRTTNGTGYVKDRILS
jgi:glycerophosphoryl diester phosphodiesterase